MKSWTIQNFLADFQTVFKVPGLVPGNVVWHPGVLPLLQKQVSGPRHECIWGCTEQGFQRFLCFSHFPSNGAFSGRPKLTDIQDRYTFVTHTALHESGSEEDTPVYRWYEMLDEILCKGFTNAELYDHRFVKLLTSATLTTWFSYALILERNLSFVTNILACRNII